MIRLGRQASVGLLALAALAVAQPSQAADVFKPLRTLVYNVALSAGIVRHEARSGLSAGPRMSRLGRSTVSGTRSRGSGDEASGGSVHTEGTISVDVVAATGDGGLVADLAESAPERTRAKVRFAVLSDGTVTYDPKYFDDVSEEEIALARWLARGFYSYHPQSVGAFWTVDQSGDGVVSAEHYRVLAVADRKVTLNYEFEEKHSGPDSMVATRSGSVVYDTGFIVPVRVSYEAHSRRELSDAFDESQTSVVLTLASDSFQKPP
jgi:hypothetical protein